jgi:hypothetical protein
VWDRPARLDFNRRQVRYHAGVEDLQLRLARWNAAQPVITRGIGKCFQRSALDGDARLLNVGSVRWISHPAFNCTGGRCTGRFRGASFRWEENVAGVSRRPDGVGCPFLYGQSSGGRILCHCQARARHEQVDGLASHELAVDGVGLDAAHGSG